jgi:hypothetical protein
MAVNSLEDEIYASLADEIAREIDEGIMSNILVETGWTPVKFHFKDNNQAVDINIWLAGTCTGDYRRLGSDYVFENKQDAEWFILRWT